MPLKRSFKADVPLVYMLFGTRNLIWRSILTPEVELMVFLRMRSDKITKNGKMPLKRSFKAKFPRV